MNEYHLWNKPREWGKKKETSYKMSERKYIKLHPWRLEHVFHYTQFTSVSLHHFDQSVNGFAQRTARTALMNAVHSDKMFQIICHVIPKLELTKCGRILFSMSLSFVGLILLPGRLFLTFIVITVSLINVTLWWFVGYILAVFHCILPDSAAQV